MGQAASGPTRGHTRGYPQPPPRALQCQSHPFGFLAQVPLKLFLPSCLSSWPRNQVPAQPSQQRFWPPRPTPPTCLQSAAMRLRLLVETVRVMGIPANFRLLLPRMELSGRLQG